MTSGSMSLTPNVRALHLYGGIIGTYLGSPKATSFDLADHSWNKVLNASNWLITNNPLFRSLSHQLSIPLSLDNSINPTAIGGLPLAHLTQPNQERTPPAGRLDLIINPFDLDPEVHNEDHHSHRLSTGTIESSRTELKYIINHDDTNLEMLLFPHSNGRGAWIYQGPASSRYSNNSHID
jgi:hypothetical protein